MRAQITLIATIVALISAAGCAPAAGPAALAPEGAEGAAILVENHNWSDMTIYVERAGIRTRLGTVTTATKRLFRIPRVLMGMANIRLIADPVGGRDVYVTRPIEVVPGQQLNFNIANHVAISSVWLSRR